MTNDIDQGLGSDAQKMVAKMVASMPEDHVSMVWRSDLNKSLRNVAERSGRRRLMFNWLSPVVGLSAACVLAAVVLVRPAPPNTKSSPVLSQPAGVSLEASLMNLHQDDVRTAEIAGTGLNPSEAVPNAVANPADYSEDDIQL